MFYLLEKLINVSHNNDSSFLLRLSEWMVLAWKKHGPSKAVPCVNPGTGMQWTGKQISQ